MIRSFPAARACASCGLSGEGADRLPPDATNRVIQAARQVVQDAGRDPSQLAAELSIHSSIPLSADWGPRLRRPLAGALLADGAARGAVGQVQVLRTVVAMEGHPDNVSRRSSGAQVSVRDANGHILSCPIEIRAPLRAALYIPDQELATSAARAVLPEAGALGRRGLQSRALGAAGGGAQRRPVGSAWGGDGRPPAPAGALRVAAVATRAARGSEEGRGEGAALSGAGTTVCALCNTSRCATWRGR